MIYSNVTRSEAVCYVCTKDYYYIFEKPSVEDMKFVKRLVTTLTETIGSLPNNHVWPKFHQLWCTDKFKVRWEQYLESYNLANEPMCYQHITLKVFEKCLKEHMRREGDAVAKTDDIIELTYKEENAIRYMGGYVIHKLQDV